MKSEKGFALIDAMLSVFVLSIGMVAVMDAFTTASKSLQNTKNVLIANMLAQSKMEMLNALPSASIANVTDISFNGTNEFATSEGNYTGFTYTLVKTTELAGYIDRLTLTVTYKVFGKTKTMTYVMLKGLKT